MKCLALFLIPYWWCTSLQKYWKCYILDVARVLSFLVIPNIFWARSTTQLTQGDILFLKWPPYANLSLEGSQSQETIFIKSILDDLLVYVTLMLELLFSSTGLVLKLCCLTLIMGKPILQSLVDQISQQWGVEADRESGCCVQLYWNKFPGVPSKGKVWLEMYHSWPSPFHHCLSCEKGREFMGVDMTKEPELYLENCGL